MNNIRNSDCRMNLFVILKKYLKIRVETTQKSSDIDPIPNMELYGSLGGNPFRTVLGLFH